MKSFAKLLLVGTVAVMAIAVSVASSEAAKKKAMAQKEACSDAALCSANCNSATDHTVLRRRKLPAEVLISAAPI